MSSSIGLSVIAIYEAEAKPRHIACWQGDGWYCANSLIKSAACSWLRKVMSKPTPPRASHPWPKINRLNEFGLTVNATFNQGSEPSRHGTVGCTMR